MKAKLLSLCVLVGILPTIALAGENSPIGKKIDNFSGRDYPRQGSLPADFADSKLVVVAFLGTECPLAKLYGPRLAELAKGLRGQGRGVHRHRRQSARLGDRDRPLRPRMLRSSFRC